jgi:flagellar biosynthesis protein FlhG
MSEGTSTGISVPIPAGLAPRLFVVGGGSGGVGKSLIAANLAVYFAQLGRSVVLVDADARGRGLHTSFGVVAATAGYALSSPVADALIDTAVQGLRLLRFPHEVSAFGLAFRGTRAERFLARLRELPAELVVVDVGAGASPFALQLLAAADLPLLVTAPEPGSVEGLYRFLRTAYRYRLKRVLAKTDNRRRYGLGVLAEAPEYGGPFDLIGSLGRRDRTLQQLAEDELRRMRFGHVVSGTRHRADAELSSWMSSIVFAHYGMSLEDFGTLEYDDTVWIAARKQMPLLVDNPAGKASRQIERLARRILLPIDPGAPSRSLPIAPARPRAAGAGPTLYELLGVPRTANDEELRRAHRKLRDVFGPESLATHTILDATAVRAEVKRLDEALDVLLDPVRRRAYDLSNFPAELSAPAPKATVRVLDEQEQQRLADLLRTIEARALVDGATLHNLREANGFSVDEVCARTRIAKAILLALESDRFAELPAPVYLRGFLAELARLYGADPVRVQKSYLARPAVMGTRDPRERG